MKIIVWVVIHWYLGFWLQSVFLHRYASHANFTMPRAGEKLGYILMFLVFGSSYMSAWAFGLMHKIHHEQSDTTNDPHSPKFTTGILGTILKSRNSYVNIFRGKTPIPDHYKNHVPKWHPFDRFAHSWYTRSVWVVLYVLLYTFLAESWWHYLFLPFTIAMSALQGGVVNWWAHSFGYRNYDTRDDSRNMLPVDLFFLGESYHNNHHKYPYRINHAVRWFEIDLTYQILLGFHRLGLIRIRKRALRRSLK